MKQFTIAIAIFVTITSSAQLPTFKWGYTFGESEPEVITDTFIDEEGNIYMVGYFGATVDVDPSENEFLLTSNFDWGGFIIKLTAEKELVWAKAITGTGFTSCSEIEVGKTGIYVAGGFRGETDFDPNEGSQLITSGSAGEDTSDPYILKLDHSGSFVWVKTFAANRTLSSNLAIDQDDNVYISGTFGSIVDFDPGENVVSLTAQGDDIFLVKLDSEGNYQWVNQVGGTSNDYAFSILTDLESNVYITGYFQNTVDFDPGENTFLLHGITDAYIQKVNSDGGFEWAISTSNFGDGFAQGESLASDENGDIYLGGYFSGEIDVFPGDEEFLLNSGSELVSEGFLLKVSRQGEFLLAKQTGTLDINDMVVDKAGNLYTASRFNTSITLSFNESETTFEPLGSTDLLYQKFESNGNLLWAISGGSKSLDVARSIARDNEGNLYLSGAFGDSLQFDLTEEEYLVTNSLNAYTFKVSECNETLGPVSIINVDNSLEASTVGDEVRYYWYDCTNETYLSGENDARLANPISGTYAIEIANSAGCTIMSECFVYQAPLSTKEGNIYVYPNPTADFVFVNTESEKQVTVFVRDISGRLITELKIEGSKQVPISLGKESGLYLVEVKGEGSKLFRVFKH